MAEIKFKTTRVNLVAGTTGTVDVVIPGFNGTPKAAIFEMVSAHTDYQQRTYLRYSQGYTDGTRQNCSAMLSEDGVSQSAGVREIYSNRVVQMFERANGASEATLTFNSFIPNGVRLNNIIATDLDWFITVTLIGGDGVTDVTTGTVVVNSIPQQTTVGYEPDLLFLNSVGVLEGADYTHAIMSVGVSHNVAGTSQANAMMFDDTGAGATNTGMYLSTSTGVGQTYNNVLNWSSRPEYNSTGWQWRVSQGGDSVAYLAIKFDGTEKVKIDTFSIPTTPSAVTIGNTDFTPDYAYIVGTAVTSLNSNLTNAAALSTSHFDADNQYCNSILAADGINPTHAKSRSSSGKFIVDSSLADTILTEADFTAFSGTGVDLNFTEVTGDARYGFVLSIGNTAAATGNTSGSSGFSIGAPVFSGSATTSAPTGGNSYYLKWSNTDQGEGLRVTGVTGRASKVELVIAASSATSSTRRYLFDTNGTIQAKSFISATQFSASNANVTSFLRNGSSSSTFGLFTASADDVISWAMEVGGDINGTLMIGADINNLESYFGLAIKSVEITDDAGVHFIDMNSSGGTGIVLTSDTTSLTATFENAPVDNSQWVLYDSGNNTVGADASFSIAPVFNVDATNSTPITPTVTATVDATIGALSFTTTGSNTVPVFSAAASMIVDEPVFSVSALTTVPVFNADTAFTLDEPIFNIEATSGQPTASTDAWAAQITSQNVDIDFAPYIDITNTESFRLEFTVDVFTNSLILVGGGSPNASSNDLIFFTAPGNLQIRRFGTQYNFALPVSAIGVNDYAITYDTVTDEVEVFQNGVSCGTRIIGSFFALTHLFPFNDNTNRKGALYRFKVFNAVGTLVHDFYNDQSADLTVFPDIVGGGSAPVTALTNPRWLLYASETVDLFSGDAAFIVDAPVFDVSASNSVPVSGNNGYYLKWSGNGGTPNANNELLQINGTVGAINIAILLAENMPLHENVNNYLFDGRRTLDSQISANINNGFLLRNAQNNSQFGGVSNYQVNGINVSAGELFNALANDIVSFDAPVQEGGTFAIGARFNEVEHLYGLAIKQIAVIDDNGTHVINMSDSAGAGTQVTSDTGTLTAKQFNFPVDNSQWNLYDLGTVDPRFDGRDYFVSLNGIDQRVEIPPYIFPSVGIIEFSLLVTRKTETGRAGIIGWNALPRITTEFTDNGRINITARTVSTGSNINIVSDINVFLVNETKLFTAFLNLDTGEFGVKLDNVVICSGFEPNISDFHNVPSGVIEVGEIFNFFGQADVYYVDINGERYYDPSAYAGDPFIIRDTVGGNDASFSGATGNSHLVSYIPDVVADAGFTVDEPVFAVSASNSVPVFNTTVDLSIAEPVFTVTADNTVPVSSNDGYYLSPPSNGNMVLITDVHNDEIPIFRNVGDYVEVQLYTGSINSGNQPALIVGRFFGTYVRLRENDLRSNFGGQTIFNPTFVSSLNNKFLTIRYEKTGETELTLTIPEIQLIESATYTGTNDAISSVFGANQQSFTSGKFYSFKVGNSAGDTTRLDGQSATGTGLTWTDAIGNNDGTLVGYDPPNDDSQWVLYDLGTLDPRFDGRDYFVKLGGNAFDQWLDLPAYTFPVSGIWYYELDFVGGDDNGLGRLLALQTGSTRFGLFIRQDNYFSIEIAGAFINSATNTFEVGKYYKLRLEINLDTNDVVLTANEQVLISVNDTRFANLVGFTTSSGDNSSIGTHFNVHFAKIDLYYADINNQHYFNPSAYTGDPFTIRDTIGGNDASFIGGVDNSHLVTYEAVAPGLTADIAFDIDAPIFSVTAASILPVTTGSLAFDLAAPVFNAAATNIVPVTQSSINTEIAIPSFSANATNSLPISGTHVSTVIAEPIFDGLATSSVPVNSLSVEFDVEHLQFSVSATNFIVPNTGIIDTQIAQPDFTIIASTSVPVNEVVASITIDQVLFSGSGTSTKPITTGTVSFEVPQNIFSIQAGRNTTTSALPIPLITGSLNPTVITTIKSSAVILKKQTTALIIANLK